MKKQIIQTLSAVFATAFATASLADNSTATAIVVQPTDFRSGLAINPAGDNDYYRLSIPSNGRLTVNSEGSTDTYGYLLNSAGGTLLSHDDIGGGNYNFSMGRDVTPGTYFVRVRHYSSSRTGAYSLRTRFVPAAPADDFGNTPDTAATLTLSGNAASRNGVLGHAGDVDVFRVSVPSAGFLNAGTTGSTDTYGHLLNGSQSELASHDDIGGGNYNFSLRVAVSAGTYFVKVRHYSSTGTGAYGLAVRFEPQAAQPQPTGSLRALVIGISDYQRINDLSLCDDDARDISTLLRASGWSVTTLIDSQASKASIQQQIARLAPGGGRFLLYYSGHGSAVDTTGYICPWDTSTTSSMISENELNSWLGAAGSTAVGVVLDSCFSGAFIGRSLAPAPVPAGARFYRVPGTVADARAGEFLARNISSSSRVVIAGCRGTQYSFESSSWGHGWLTYKLLGALRSSSLDTTRNGWVSLEEGFVSTSGGIQMGGDRQDPQLYDGNGAAHLDTGRL